MKRRGEVELMVITETRRAARDSENGAVNGDDAGEDRLLLW